MTKTDFEQLAQALHSLGVTIEWVDLAAETLLIRAIPARR